MMQGKIKNISERLKILTGTKLKSVQRNHGDIWIYFVDINNKSYTLLMQTLFRLCDEAYGKGNYDTGPTSDYNMLKKYGDRAFKNP